MHLLSTLDYGTDELTCEVRCFMFINYVFVSIEYLIKKNMNEKVLEIILKFLNNLHRMDARKRLRASIVVSKDLCFINTCRETKIYELLVKLNFHERLSPIL